MLSPRRWSRGRLQHVDLEILLGVAAELPVSWKGQGAVEARTAAGADPAAAHAHALGWISRRLTIVSRKLLSLVKVCFGRRRRWTVDAWRGEEHQAEEEARNGWRWGGRINW